LSEVPSDSEEMDMNTIRRAQLGFAAFVLVGGLASAAAAQDRPQQPATPPPSDQPATPPSDAAAPPADQAPASDKMASKKIKGELLSVDDATKTLTIRTEDGSEVKVAYNEQTKISGATDQAAGLATAAGSKVKVEASGEGASAVATKITVEAKK
jgi:YD repeat-containing protein